MQTLYRIQTDAYHDTILDGIGAQQRGGRWNAKGRPMVYAATTPELCFLDYMVHLDGTPLTDLPPLILCTIAVPDGSVLLLEISQLPIGWNTLHGETDLPAFANALFRQHHTLCLGIPSAVVPSSPSRNVLLDPLHPLRAQCIVTHIEPYPIDPRLPTATA